jgi:hypothetical protein
MGTSNDHSLQNNSQIVRPVRDDVLSPKKVTINIVMFE